MALPTDRGSISIVTLHLHSIPHVSHVRVPTRISGCSITLSAHQCCAGQIRDPVRCCHPFLLGSCTSLLGRDRRDMLRIAAHDK